MSEQKQETTDRTEELRALLRERILVIDGAMGTTIREYNLTEEDIRGERFKDAKKDLKNNGDLFSLTRPDIISDIHKRFLEAGADIIETNTFSATSLGQHEFFVEDPRETGGRRRQGHRQTALCRRSHRAVDRVSVQHTGRRRRKLPRGDL